MGNRTKISVITPSFNQGKYIERTIQSVLSQEVEDLEYTVIDGGSSDETLSILKRYADRVPWISEPDSGPSDAINKGFLRSTGEILGWLNSDDIYYPGALQTVLDFFERNPDAEVMYGDANHIDADDNFIEKYPTEDWRWERLKETCFISQPATFFRRSVFDRHGPLEIGLRSMDYDYWLRLGKNKVRFVHVPKLMAATRLHKDAFTVAGRLAGAKEVNSTTRKHLSRTPSSHLFHYAHVVAAAKGYDRGRRPIRFIMTLILYSLYAALRWNRRISKDVLRVVFGWYKRQLIPEIKKLVRRPFRRVHEIFRAKRLTDKR